LGFVLVFIVSSPLVEIGLLDSNRPAVCLSRRIDGGDLVSRVMVIADPPKSR
jgi:hypothetical protein